MTQPTTTTTQKVILIVDDFEDNRVMYAEYLTFSGFRVEQAKDGKEALKKATELLPDLVVMDLSLPVMDGWEATRQLKQAPRTRGIPVLALTGHALTGYSRKAREAGCDAFVAKPCLPDTLLDEVRRMLEHGGTGRTHGGRKSKGRGA